MTDNDRGVSENSRPRGAPAPRRRRLRACDSCRQRKIRCDNLPGSCRNCQTYGGNCVITRDGRSAPRSNAFDTSRSLINRMAGQKSPSDATPGHLCVNSESNPSPSNSVSSMTRGFQSRFSRDEAPSIPVPYNHNTLSLPQPHASATKSSPGQASDISLGQLSRSADSIQGVITTEVGQFPRNSKFAGTTSPQAFAKSVEELFNPAAAHLDVMAFFCPTMTFAEELPFRSPDLYPLVEKEQADPCLHRFFNTYHTLFPMLDMKMFSEDYQMVYQSERHVEPAVVACIFLAVALGCEDWEMADMHFRAACRLHGDLIARPYLSSVQALILMALYAMNTGRDAQAHLDIGIAARIAQSIGLHRSLSTHNHPHEFSFVLKEYSLRSSIWWTCYCLDKKLSFELGRPSAIRDEECDADLPDVVRAFAPSVQDVAEDCFSEFLSSFIELSRKLSRISSGLFSISASNLDERAIVDLMDESDTLLQDWRATIPDSLIPDNDSDSAGTRGDIASVATRLLNCIYLNAVVVVHRVSLLCKNQSHYITSHSNRRIAGSRKTCLDAAHSLAHMINNLIADSMVIPTPRWVHPYAINAVMVIFLSLMRSPRKWSREIDLALLRSMHYCFQNREDAALLGRFETLLGTLVEAIETSGSNEQSSGFESNGSSKTQTDPPLANVSSPLARKLPHLFSDDPLQRIGLDGQIYGVARDGGNEFSDPLGDRHDLWNFRLWPLAPLDMDGGLSIAGTFDTPGLNGLEPLSEEPDES